MTSRWRVVLSWIGLLLAIFGGIQLGIIAVDVSRDLAFLRDIRQSTDRSGLVRDLRFLREFRLASEERLKQQQKPQTPTP